MMDDPEFKLEIESYKVENENLKRDNDRITFDYELKLENLKKEIDLKTSNYDNLMNNFQEIESKFKNGCDEKITLNQTYHDLSKEKFEIVKKLNTLESDYSTISELLSRREKELLLSKNEIHDLQSKLDKYRMNEMEMKLNEQDIEYRKKDIDQIEEMSAKRNKRLSDDINTLQDKLAKANKDLFDERSKNNSAICDLKLELENKKNEMKNQKKLNDKLKDNMLYLEKVYEEKTESLRSALEGKSNIDSILRKDLNAQKAITELFKAERDELLEKQATFEQTIYELQDAFRENCESSTNLKNECESKLEEFEGHVSELRKSLNKKEKELEDANVILEKFRVKSMSEEDLRDMNPATAAAIGALKRGYSLTQMYSEYLQVTCERNELKLDRDRLNEYIKSVLEELEEKAPSLRKQQEERSHMESALTTIGQKYEKTLSNLFNSQSDADDLRKRCEELNKKLKREEQTSTDLKQQVCCLLREVETCRGTVIRSNGDGNQQSMFNTRMRNVHQMSLMKQSNSSLVSNNSLSNGTNRSMTANDVITTHLVTFKNICELEQQNIKLLEQLRDLSQELESHEGLINEQSLQQVAKRLEKASTEVDGLREKVKHQKYLEKVIERQRHIIQALTTFSGNNDLAVILKKTPLNLDCSDNTSQALMSINDSHNVTLNTVNSQADPKLNVDAYEKRIDKLQSKVDKLQEERDSLKDCHQKSSEELNNQLTDLKVTNESIVLKIGFSQEKCSTMEQNLINRQLEMADLQTELSASNIELSQKKEELKSAKSELLASQAAVKNYENSIKELHKALKDVDALEQQVRAERSEKYELTKSMNNIATQMANLQSLVVSSRNEDSSEEQQNSKTRIKQLSLELKQERSKYQTSQEMWQAKLNESSVKIDALNAQLSVCSKTNVASSSDNRRIVEHQKSPEKVEKLNNLEEQIEDLLVTNSGLTKKLERFQEILSNSESKLVAHSQVMEQVQSEVKQKLDEEKKMRSDLEEELANFRTANEVMEAEYETVKDAMTTRISELSTMLEQERKTVETLKTQEAVLQEKFSLMKMDLERQRQLTKEAMDNYQQELIFHAQESDRLQEVTDQLRKYQSQDRDLSQKLKEAVVERDQYKSDMDNKGAAWNDERVILQQDIEELRVQRESLNTRLIDQKNIILNLKKMVYPSIDDVVDQAVIQQESDWTEVIQYLRQEKEAAETSKNQLEMDLYRLRNENAAQEETINQLNAVLAEERTFKIKETETSKHHAEIMSKLETVQMLSESNAMLRKDRERMKDDLNDKVKRVASLQEMVEPLKQELKAKKNDMESMSLEMRSMENERNLWRGRCDSLIEKSKQINPEEFKIMCTQKDDLQHKFLIEEEKCRNLKNSIEEMERLSSDQSESLKVTEEELEEMRRLNDENVNVVQKRDTLISQLKEIGRKYKAEKETLTSEITKVTEIRDTQGRELQNLRVELSALRRMQQDVTAGQDRPESASKNPESSIRLKIIENQLAQLKSENESLRQQLISHRTSLDLDVDSLRQDDVASDPSQLHVVPVHVAPTVARVAANVHPLVQKHSQASLIAGGSNQISPSSQSMSSCQSSTARQTAEIRPIPAVVMHASTVSSSSSDTVEPMATVSVTTSLPANVVQALAATSVSATIHPMASQSTSSVSTIARMKRRLSVDAPVATQSAIADAKKIRLRDTSELGESSSYGAFEQVETLQEREEVVQMTSQFGDYEVEVTSQDVEHGHGEDGEVESEEQSEEEERVEVEERRGAEVEARYSGSSEDEEEEEDYEEAEEDDNEDDDDDDDDDEDGDEDDEPMCIDLLTSDEGSDDGADDGQAGEAVEGPSAGHRQGARDQQEREAANVEGGLFPDLRQQQDGEKKKIELITWSGTQRAQSDSVHSPSTSQPHRQPAYSKFSPHSKATPLIKSPPSGRPAYSARRKLNPGSARHFQYGGPARGRLLRDPYARR